MEIPRYQESSTFTTARDPLQDLAGMISFFSSTDYATETLISVHKVTQADARARGKRVAPHARMALAFLDQTLSSAPEVAFLPAYYAILNLMKIVILCGPFHREMVSNKHHGATYDVTAKDSHHLLTERIKVRERGVIALFYRTLTGEAISSAKDVKIGDVYSCLLDVGAEYHMATGKPYRLIPLRLSVEPRDANARLAVQVFPPDATNVSRSDLKLVRNLRKEKGDLVGPWLPLGNLTQVQFTRSQIRSELIYYGLGSPYPELVIVAPRISSLLTPEEIPIALAFFHLSSIVRYKPEFFARVRDSRHWPIIVAARQHSLFKFLLLFWCFTQQRLCQFRRV